MRLINGLPHSTGQQIIRYHDLVKQGQEMVVFRLSVLVGRVNAVIQREKIARFAAAVHPIDQPGTGDHAVRIARVLALGHVDGAAVAIVLYAVVNEQKDLGEVAEQGNHQFTQLIDGQCTRAQKPIHLVVAHVGQMGCQVRSGVAVGRIGQVLDVSGLGQHERAFLPKLSQSA